MDGQSTGATLGSIAGSLFGGPVGMGIGQIAGGLLGGLIGGGQKRKARDILAQNRYPAQVIPKELLDNQQRAQMLAQQGLPSQQYDQAVKNIERGRTAATRMAVDRRGGLGMINPIQTAASDALGELGVADANARLQNQRTAMQVNQDVARAKQSAFDWNEKNKYQQDREYGMGLLGAGNVNQLTGIDKALAGVGLIGSGLNWWDKQKQPNLAVQPFNQADFTNRVSSFMGNIPKPIIPSQRRPTRLF